MILICQESYLPKVAGLNVFAKTYTATTFEFNELYSILQQIKKDVFAVGDKTFISTLFEFNVLTAARLRDEFREKLSIRGSGEHLINLFRDKLKMKAVLSGKVQLPKHTRFDPELFLMDEEKYLSFLEETINYPMFIKPIDGAGSAKTDPIRNRKELHSWCSQHLKEKRAFEKSSEQQIYEIDEYIDGDLYHCDSVIQNRKIQATLVSQYLHPNADARSGGSLATMMMRVTEPEYRKLQKFAEDALREFPELPDGVTHLEVFNKRSTNELIFLEVAARPPGSKAPEVYFKRTGVDIRKLHTQLNLGLNCSADLELLKDPDAWTGPYAAMRDIVTPPEDSFVTALHKPVLYSEYLLKWKVKVNDLLAKNKFNAETMGSLVFWSKSYAALKEDFFSLDKLKLVDKTPATQFKSIISPEHSQNIRPVVDKNTIVVSHSNLPFDFGKWSSTVGVDPDTREPIFYYNVYKNNILVGKASFYGQPLLCKSINGKRHNIIELAGVLKQFPIDDTSSITEICRILPGSMFKKVLISSGQSALHGAVKGGEHLLGVYLNSRGGYSAQMNYCLKKLFYAGGYFTMQLTTYLAQDEWSASLNNVYTHVTQALLDTGTRLAVDLSFDLLTTLLKHIEHHAKQYPFYYLKSGVGAVRNLLSFGFFGIGAAQHDLKYMLPGIIAGKAGELAITSLGESILKR